MMVNYLQITTDEYESLLKAKLDLEIAKDVLLKHATTGWAGKYLAWNDEATSAVLRYIIGDAYDEKLEELTKEDGK